MLRSELLKLFFKKIKLNKEIDKKLLTTTKQTAIITPAEHVFKTDLPETCQGKKEWVIFNPRIMSPAYEMDFAIPAPIAPY